MLYEFRGRLELCFGESSSLDLNIKDVVDILKKALREVKERGKGKKIGICGLCLEQLVNVRAYALQAIELVNELLKHLEVVEELPQYANP